MSMANSRITLTLYAAEGDLRSHWLRLVIAEKRIAANIVDVPVDELPEDVLALNPYGTLPVLVDRDVCLYDPRVAMEYLDERFPQPPLMPVAPGEKAKLRQLANRVEREWCGAAEIMLTRAKSTEGATARKHLRDSLIAVSPVFNELPFFMSQEMTLVDCLLAPVLWHLPRFALDLPEKPCRGLLKYRSRILSRPSFQQSLKVTALGSSA